MLWIVENWGFIAGVGLIITILSKIAWQTKRNSKDIMKLEQDICDQKKEAKEFSEKISSGFDNIRSDMQHGFNRLEDKMFGMLKSEKKKS